MSAQSQAPDYGRASGQAVDVRFPPSVLVILRIMIYVYGVCNSMTIASQQLRNVP
jgi:hypothetical protein